MRNIHVSYDSVQALRGVDFDLARGEIHGLVGEHRAGKSTLVKLLSGAVTKGSGTITYDGREVPFFTPKTAMQNRISIVYQSMNVIPSISAIENIFTGQRIASRFGFVDRKAMERRAERMFERLNVAIDPHTRLENLTEAEQLMVEIAKALSIDPELIIFDEISSKLTPREMETIYRLLFDFKRRNRSVIYITHNMDEILEFADRVTVLKNGMRQGTEEIHDLDKLKLIKMTYSFILSREELEQDNRELFLLKRFNENIIKNLPIGVVILDQELRVSIINFSALRILGLANESINEKPLEDLLSRAAVERAAEIVERAGRKEEYCWDELHCAGARHEANEPTDSDGAIGTDGTLVRIRIFPFKDEDYKQIGTICVIEDISRDRYFQDYLLRSEKIASIAELATGVAHEISNPLSVVLNYIDLLKRKHRNDRDSERLAKIERELSRIGEIIGSLLSFSRVRKIPSMPVNIGAVIRDVALLVDHKIKEKLIALRLPDGDSDLFVWAEENSLKQVFVNLLINSIEAVLEHGTIEIRVKTIQPEEWVEIAVVDDGCGIPADVLDQVFDPFFSTKTGKRNTGLGLSICQHIVESHDGLITCTCDERTVVSVRLPLCIETA